MKYTKRNIQKLLDYFYDNGIHFKIGQTGLGFSVEWWTDKGYCFIDDQSSPPYIFRVSVNSEISENVLKCLGIESQTCRFFQEKRETPLDSSDK